METEAEMYVAIWELMDRARAAGLSWSALVAFAEEHYPG